MPKFPGRGFKWRPRLVKLALPFAVILLLGYTADQLLTGERGIVTWRLMQKQVQELREKNAGMQADVTRLENRVDRLKPNEDGRLDEDYVEELIRSNLPMVKNGEDIVFVSPTVQVE